MDFNVFIETEEQIIDAGDGVYLDVEGNYVYPKTAVDDDDLPF